MGEVTPICAGAQYRNVGCGTGHGDVLRVKSVWIDENGDTQVQIFTEDEHKPNPSHRTIDAESFIKSIDESLIRINSDHEAWEWRN